MTALQEDGSDLTPTARLVLKGFAWQQADSPTPRPPRTSSISHALAVHELRTAGYLDGPHLTAKGVRVGSRLLDPTT